MKTKKGVPGSVGVVSLSCPLCLQFDCLSLQNPAGGPRWDMSAHGTLLLAQKYLIIVSLLSSVYGGAGLCLASSCLFGLSGFC